MQGYKTGIGFKIQRRSIETDGSRCRKYTFTRYGWSTGMLKWRSPEFAKKLYYLEVFLMEENKDKIDTFLFKDRRVLIEKSYKWSSPQLPTFNFRR